jgi:hypothetical protein
MSLTLAPNPSLAGETDALMAILKQVDKQVCQSPKTLTDYYTKDMVIIADDKRVLPEHRIKDYEVMIAGSDDRRTTGNEMQKSAHCSVGTCRGQTRLPVGR